MARADAGFSLIEAIMAVLLMASLIALLGQGTAGGWRGIAVAEHERRALAVAEAELAGAGSAWPLVPGTRQGVSEGYRYTTEVRAHAGPAAVSGGDAPSLYMVAVDVRWRQGLSVEPRRVRLTTFRLASRP
jgi:type II secretory pathway pseudopilin PulG